MKYEEAIELRPGTPVLIRSKVVSVDVTGDIVYEVRAHDQEYEVMRARTDCKYVDALPSEKPKYDPCRKFKKGDRVRIVEYKGRPGSYYWKERVGQILTVTMDETTHSLPEVDGQDINPAYIELVTPADELEPYYIEECSATCEVWNNIGDRAIAAMFFKSQYRSHQARELAEAECKRLNAEWRKTQNYKQD